MYIGRGMGGGDGKRVMLEAPVVRAERRGEGGGRRGKGRGGEGREGKGREGKGREGNRGGRCLTAG